MADEKCDYEGMPESSSVTTHMVAGAAAGIMEHGVMYPVDCVKTRMQVLKPDPRANYRNVGDALIRIVKYEGIRRSVRGVSAMIGGAGPAHAMYFASYEAIKKKLHREGKSNHIAYGIAGSAATVLHDAVMNPAEVIKQRMQVYGSPYKTCLQCGRNVLQKEGMNAYYRSFTTQVAMNIPFQSLHFVIYETCQDQINKNHEYNPVTHCISGATAGGVAAAMTTPLDVCKTTLNTQPRYRKEQAAFTVGLFNTATSIYKNHGVLAFFRGLQARVIFQMPATAISWFVYELFKNQITKYSSTDSDTGYCAVTPSLQTLPTVNCNASESVVKNETTGRHNVANETMPTLVHQTSRNRLL